jgi:hypothetical protein
MEFIVNEYLSLKLKRNKTIIYVNGKRFMQCIRLVLQIPRDDIRKYDQINSIDEAADLNKTLWQNRVVQGPRAKTVGGICHNITPEEEFRGHCSNLQVWAENAYDTRLLHRNIAFPLLRKLARVGDSTARKIFKEEILSRIEEGNEIVIKYLKLGKYFNTFSEEDIESKRYLQKYPRGILILLGIRNKAPDSLYSNLYKLMNNIEFAKWGIYNNAPKAFYDNFNNLIEKIDLLKLGVQNDVPIAFYENFWIVAQNIKLTEWSIRNGAINSFYSNFLELQEDLEFAKWGAQHNAPESFFNNFKKLLENIDFAKWALQKKAPPSFFHFFDKLIENVGLAKLGLQYKAPDDFYESFDQLKKNIAFAKWGVKNKFPGEFYEFFAHILEDLSLINDLLIPKKKRIKFFEKFNIDLYL